SVGEKSVVVPSPSCNAAHIESDAAPAVLLAEVVAVVLLLLLLPGLPATL
ncbi:hypothetical protein A2U01_0094217, partial [Trifolium medium]|nr:hypothetical protein [Trifolium medium]